MMFRNLFTALLVTVAISAAHAAPQWLNLPPTPTLPRATQSGFAPVNGIKVWYATFGRGEPVLLLHGGLANANYWGHQVRALQRHYQVIVMDSRGQGRSSRNEHPGRRPADPAGGQSLLVPAGSRAVQRRRAAFSGAEGRREVRYRRVGKATACPPVLS